MAIGESKTYDMTQGTSLDQGLRFMARGVRVDNWTNQPVYVKATGLYCPPWTVYWTAPIPASNNAQATFAAPPGVSLGNIPQNPGRATLVFTEDELSFSAGVIIPAPAASSQTTSGTHTVGTPSFIIIPVGNATTMLLLLNPAGANTITISGSIDGGTYNSVDIIRIWFPPAIRIALGAVTAPGGYYLMPCAGFAFIGIQITGAAYGDTWNAVAVPGPQMLALLGQQPAASSYPVVIASDQPTAIPVTGTMDLSKVGGVAVSSQGGQQFVVLAGDQSSPVSKVPNKLPVGFNSLGITASTDTTLLSGVSLQAIFLFLLYLTLSASCVFLLYDGVSTGNRLIFASVSGVGPFILPYRGSKMGIGNSLIARTSVTVTLNGSAEWSQA